MATSTLIDEVRLRRFLDPAIARAVRVESGITRRRLAAELGVHETTIATWELGTRHPRGPLAIRYAELLEQLAVAVVGE